MPVGVTVVKRARRRSFALLWAIPAWIGSLWAASRKPAELPSPVGVEAFARDAGMPALRISPEGSHRCTGCDLCVSICPSRALSLEFRSPAQSGVPVDLTRFTLDVGRCIGCGRCVDDCPEAALEVRPTPDVALAKSSGQADPVFLFERRGEGQ